MCTAQQHVPGCCLFTFYILHSHAIMLDCSSLNEVHFHNWSIPIIIAALLQEWDHPLSLEGKKYEMTKEINLQR